MLLDVNSPQAIGGPGRNVESQGARQPLNLNGQHEGCVGQVIHGPLHIPVLGCMLEIRRLCKFVHQLHKSLASAANEVKIEK